MTPSPSGQRSLVTETLVASSYVAPLLAHDEARIIVSALHGYLSETEHYLRARDYEPCAPGCPHCQPRVDHHADVRRGMQQRADAICRALDVLDAAMEKAAAPTAKGDSGASE